MKKIILSIATLAAFAGTAVEGQISGTVSSFDRGTGVIVLDDGSTAAIPLHVGVPGDLQAGSYAMIQFDSNDGDVATVFTDTLFDR